MMKNQGSEQPTLIVLLNVSHLMILKRQEKKTKGRGENYFVICSQTQKIYSCLHMKTNYHGKKITTISNQHSTNTLFFFLFKITGTENSPH